MSDKTSSLSIITPLFIKTVKPEILDAIKPIIDKYGISANFNAAGSYDSNSVLLKLELCVINKSTGLADTKERRDFRQNAIFWGLSPDDLDRHFVYNNKSYKIIGARPKSRAYPIIGESVAHGKRYKFPVSAVTQDLYKVKARPSANQNE